MKILIVIAGFLTAQAASAQDCSSVIALSKITSSTVSSQNKIEQAAANFCSEYSQAKSQGHSMNAGASYYAISGSFGSSSSEIEQVASKYCSSSNSYDKADNAYQQYINDIAPGAYDAYKQCLSLSNSDISFSIDNAAMLPKQLIITVNYTNHQGNSQTANMSFIASSDVVCAWSTGAGANIVMLSPQTASLLCRRAQAGQKGFITVTRTNGGSKISLPWPAYNTDGVPVDTVSDLNQRIAALQKSLDSSTAAANSAISSLNAHLEEERQSRPYTFVSQASACAPGWTQMGLIGVIARKSEYSTLNMGSGGDFNPDWRWTHPILCKRN